MCVCVFKKPYFLANSAGTLLLLNFCPIAKVGTANHVTKQWGALIIDRMAQMAERRLLSW